MTEGLAPTIGATLEKVDIMVEESSQLTYFLGISGMTDAGWVVDSGAAIVKESDIGQSFLGGR